jgi:hypothetical protein
VIPRRPGDHTPIKHVIYVLKENRTYDQVYGSLGKGNGDPELNLFGEESAPNHRELARRFVTLDNFYAAGEVSADGWDWSTQANANPALQQNWPRTTPAATERIPGPSWSYGSVLVRRVQGGRLRLGPRQGDQVRLGTVVHDQAEHVGAVVVAHRVEQALARAGGVQVEGGVQDALLADSTVPFGSTITE